jgi:hypothetical protein
MVRLISISLFFLLLAIPGLLTVLKIASGHEEVRNGFERRDLVTTKAVIASFKAGELAAVKVMPQMGAAFKDQLVFRPQITALVNRRLVSLKQSTSKKISIGKDSFWFQTAAPKFSYIPCAAPAGINIDATKAMLKQYTEFEKRAQDRGVKAYAIIVPLSSTVYSEFLPEPLRSSCRGYEPILDKLLRDENYGRILYDLDWFKAQKRGFIYDPRSFHWSREGAQSYFEYLVSTKLSDELPVVPFGAHRNRTDDLDNASDLGVAPISHTQSTRTLTIFPKKVAKWNEVRGEDDLGGLIRPNTQQMIHVTQGTPFQGTSILFGDSFTAMVWPYFSSHFETAYRFQSSFLNLDVGALDNLLDQVETDYIFILWIESKFIVLGNKTTAANRVFLPPQPQPDN